MLETRFRELSLGLPRRSIDVSTEDFEVWTRLHRFRTSYRDMSSCSPVKLRSYAIPGYSGFIPGTTSALSIGKPFTRVAKEMLLKEKWRKFMLTENPEAEEPQEEETTYKAEILDRESMRNMLHRTSDDQEWKAARVTQIPAADLSGWHHNRMLHDGHGWKNHHSLFGDMKPTEYRTRFNKFMPYHPSQWKHHLRRLKKRSLNY